MCVDGELDLVMPTARWVNKLSQAINILIHGRPTTRKELERVVGHITSVLLIFRQFLSILTLHVIINLGGWICQGRGFSFFTRSPWGVEKLGALAIDPGGWICAFCQLTPGGAFSWKILAAALGGG